MFCTSVVGLDAAEPRAQQKGHREQSPAAGLCSGGVESALAAVDRSLQVSRPTALLAGRISSSAEPASATSARGGRPARPSPRGALYAGSKGRRAGVSPPVRRPENLGPEPHSQSNVFSQSNVLFDARARIPKIPLQRKVACASRW